MRFNQLRYCRKLIGAHFREHELRLLLATLAMAGYSLAELSSPWPLKLILDHLLLHRPLPQHFAFLGGTISAHPETAVACVASFIFVIAGLKGVFAYAQIWLTSQVGFLMVHRLRRELFERLQELPLSFHQSTRSGELMAKLTQDTTMLKDAFAGSLVEVFGHVLTLTGMAGILVFLNWRLAALVFLTLPLLVWTVFRIYYRGKVSARRQRESDGRLSARISESLRLTLLVRAFAREAVEREQFSMDSEHSTCEGVRSTRVEAAATRTVEIVNAAGTWVAVLFGSLLVLRGEITPGILIVFASYLTGMYKPLRNLAKLAMQASKAVASAERIEEILSMQPDQDFSRKGIAVDSIQGDIVFENVSFGYHPGRPILKNLSFQVRAGERVALVGPSGVGKSTIVNLLLRFCKADSGRILIDGIDINDLDRESYRREIGVVLQDSLLFGATIADNISYGKPESTYDEIRKSAAQASALEFIESLPHQFQTRVSEAGVSLSGGQRQRICLARAFIKQPSLLILDEPTSAVDAESTAVIHEAIHTEQAGKTTIVISHAFYGMDSFDRILVLQDGALAESGSHAELLGRQGIYWELYSLQGLGEALGVSQ
jgi:ATP-binding cassette, subfamily B, bacterial